MAAPATNPLQFAINSIGRRGNVYLTRSELAHKYFLNPVVPKALWDDPDGKLHAKLGITDEQGKPLTGLKKGDPIPLVLRWYQKEVVDLSHKRKVIRFGRRTGKSFMMAVDIAVEAVTNPQAKILILTPNESQIKMIFDDYLRPLFRTYRHQQTGVVGLEKRMDGVVPPSHDLSIVTDTKKPMEITLSNGVTIRGMVMTNAARGQTATYVVIDEADYADNDALIGIVSPIMMSSPETKVFMASTPTGRTESYYYQRCHDKNWKEFKRDFTVLPHYGPALHDEMAAAAGGENTNAFQQEYLAEWGTEAKGVFDQEMLNLSFYIGPFMQLSEDVNRKTRERLPLLAATTSLSGKTQDHNLGALPFSWDLGGWTEIGAESLWKSPTATPGIITAGTDWNEDAGMQTVVIWWPDKEWLRQGHLKVARFDYVKKQPITGERAKLKDGRVREFTVGSDNGQPGGPHDLSQVEGIVIWHGRLERGYFNWQTAANRAISLMAIPHFLDCWYVDYGYGAQVLKMIEGIMASGQYLPDQHLITKARDIEPSVLKNVLAFHPDNDFEKTGKKFKSVNFAKPYPYVDFGYAERGDLTKDVLINVSTRRIAERKILIPYGELFRMATSEELGYVTEAKYDAATNTFGPEQKVALADRDVVEDTCAEQPKGNDSFGGLVHQLRSFKRVGTTPTGRPRYEGPDHAIDAFMLAVLAYEENYREASAENFARKEARVRTAQAERLLASTSANAIDRRELIADGVETQGDFTLKRYKNWRAPLEALLKGRAKPQQVGTSMEKMLEMARRHVEQHGI